jgi:tetratricopeptide (TPR) repeat protein
MRRAVAGLPICFLIALAVSPARADKQYCTPEAYLPSQIEASLKVCDAMIADKRHPLRDYVQAYENRGDLYMRKGQFDVAMQNYDRAVAVLAKASKITNTATMRRVFGGAPMPIKMPASSTRRFAISTRRCRCPPTTPCTSWRAAWR